MITKSNAAQMEGEMIMVSDLTDGELFHTLTLISDELAARVSTRKLLTRLDPEQLGLFPAALLDKLIGEDKVLSVESACRVTGWLTRQTIYNGIKPRTLYPLPHLKVADRLLFLDHWLVRWRGSVKKGRPRRHENMHDVLGE